MKIKTKQKIYQGGLWGNKKVRGWRTNIPSLDETEAHQEFVGWSDRPPTDAQRRALTALGYHGGCQTADEAAAILDAFRAR